LESTCRVLGLVTGRPLRDASQDWIIHRRAAEILVQISTSRLSAARFGPIWPRGSKRHCSQCCTVPTAPPTASLRLRWNR
jgi:hypothetical protein